MEEQAMEEQAMEEQAMEEQAMEEQATALGESRRSCPSRRAPAAVDGRSHGEASVARRWPMRWRIE